MRLSRVVSSLVLLLALVSIGAGAGSEHAGAASVRVAVIGDINGSYGTVGYSPEVRSAINRIVELRPDLVVGVGDLVSGQRPSPFLDRRQLEEMWAAFFREVWDPLAAAGIPFAPVAGNHDASAEPAFALERQIFAEQWQRHRPDVQLVGDGVYPFRYAFVIEGVLFVVCDATRIGPLAVDQRRWLANLLASAPAVRARIVAGHVPIRPFTHGRETETLADEALEEVLRNGGVDAYLSGHHHAFYPGFCGGFLQVTQGCLGSGARRLLGDDERAACSFTMIEIAASGPIRIDALASPDFVRPVDRMTLPRSIRYGAVECVRDDVALSDAAFPGQSGDSVEGRE